MKRNLKLPDLIVVPDSTVWISALHFGGTPRQALNIARQEGRIAACAYIRAEVQRALVRKFDWSPSAVERAFKGYLDTAPDVPISGRLTGICRDPKDDAILECAKNASASILITGDRDLLVLNLYEGIQILQPRAFVELFSG